MSAVFFKLSARQNEELSAFMDEEGYTSKAEFFRFLLKFYKYKKDKEYSDLMKSADELGALVTKLNKEGKLKTSSLEEAIETIEEL